MNFFIYGFSEGLVRVIPFLTILLLADILDVSVFGELTTYYIIFELSNIIINNNVAVKTKIDFFEKTSFVLLENIKSDLALSAIFASFAAFLVLMFHSLWGGLYVYLVIFAASVFKTFSNIALSLSQCEEEARKFSYIQLSYVATYNLLVISFVILHFGLNSWFIAIFFASLMQAFVGIKLNYNHFRSLFSPGVRITTRKMRSQLSRGMTYLPQALGFWLRLGMDRMILYLFYTYELVGVYMFGFQVLMPIIILANVCNLYLTPITNKLLKARDYGRINSLIKRFVFLLLAISIANYFSAIYIIENHFQKYSQVVDFLFLMYLSITFYAVSLVLMNLFYYIGKGKFVSALIGISSAIQFFVAYNCVSLFGLSGLLYANVVMSALVLGFTLQQYL